MDTGRAIDEGLQQLFEAGLELALAIQADAMTAATPEARAKLASAFHRVSRGVRQTAALKMRLERDAERSAREAAADARARHAKRIDGRKAVLAKVIDQVIEHEIEEDERLDASEDLRARLELEALDAEAFLDEPVEQQIARICSILDLPAPPLSGEVSAQTCSGATEGGSAAHVTTAHPREGGDPSGVSTPQLQPDRCSAWTPACAGVSGNELEFDAAPPPELRSSG